jgi:methionyl-tRNA formyltransferase
MWMAADLYADGELALWALKNIDVTEVGHVITYDPLVEALGRERGFKTIRGGPDGIRFDVQQTALSLHYHAILSPDILNNYDKIYNLHPGLLPWGRGYYPVFWAIWEQTPAGATLHEVTARLDAGPIVAQFEVGYTDEDTGWTLHQRVFESEQALFRSYWCRVSRGETLPVYHQSEWGTYHSRRQFFDMKRPSSVAQYETADLIRLTRALTFPGYSGLEIQLGTRRFELRLSEMGKSDG